MLNNRAGDTVVARIQNPCLFGVVADVRRTKVEKWCIYVLPSKYTNHISKEAMARFVAYDNAVFVSIAVA